MNNVDEKVIDSDVSTVKIVPKVTVESGAEVDPKVKVVCLKNEDDPLTVKVNRFKVKVDPLKVKVDPLKVNDDFVNVKVDSLKVKVDPLKVKVDPMSVKDDPLNVKVEPVNVKVDPLKVKVDSLKAKVDSLNVKVNSLEAMLDRLEGQVDHTRVPIVPMVTVNSEAAVDPPKVNVDPPKVTEDREFDFLCVDPLRYQRSSSLKATSQSPPGTPHQKKAVRFADALGLDLESVRHILNSTEPPYVPRSATSDLNLNTDSELDRNGRNPIAPDVPCLRAWFPNPSVTCPDFERQVVERKIRLATCVLDSANLTVGGTIWVSNFAFEKTVTVRYTTNAWVTFTDVDAEYVSGSGDGRTDYFRFAVELRDYFLVGSRMEFSVRLNCDGDTYWDSNNGNNYRVECCAAIRR